MSKVAILMCTVCPEDRDKWRALVNAVMNLQVPEIVGNFLLAVKLITFEKKF